MSCERDLLPALAAPALALALFAAMPAERSHPESVRSAGGSASIRSEQARPRLRPGSRSVSSRPERLARAEAPGPGDQGPFLENPQPRETVLSNGMRLIVEERPQSETLALRLLLRGGDLDTPIDRRALADLHASLLVRATREKTEADLARATAEIGARLFSSSSLRNETIGMSMPAEHLESAVELIAEMLLRTRLDPYDLEKEKALLVESLASSRDTPGTYLLDETYRALFPDHPLSRLVRLEDEEVRAVSIDDVRKFHASRVSGKRIALIAVGRCEASAVEKIARKVFADLSATSEGAGGAEDDGKGARDRSPAQTRPLTTMTVNPGPAETGAKRAPFASPTLPPPAPLPTDVRRAVRRRTTQAEIMIALPIDGISDEDAPALSMLRQILGGFQERLYSEIREKRGYAYWLRLAGFSTPTAGWIGVHTGATKKNLPEIERVARAELARITSEPVSADDLERARRFLTTAEARQDITNEDRAATLSLALLDGRPMRSYEERAARLAAVTPDQIRDLARRLFQGKHYAVVTLQ